MLEWDLCLLRFMAHNDLWQEVNILPNIKSAKKRVLITEKKNHANAAQKSALRTSVKKAKIAIAHSDANVAGIVKDASVSLDKAATKGLIHKNTAARKKSRLAKAMNRAQAAQ